MKTTTKLRLAWKYRACLWKYRNLIRHRREIAGVTGAVLGVAVVLFLRRHA